MGHFENLAFNFIRKRQNLKIFEIIQGYATLARYMKKHKNVLKEYEKIRNNMKNMKEQ